MPAGWLRLVACPTPPCPCLDGFAQVRLSAVVEKGDVEEVQSLVDFILKSDPSAQETRRSGRWGLTPAGQTAEPTGGCLRLALAL